MYILSSVYETQAGISVEITPDESESSFDEGDTLILLYKPSFWDEEGLSEGDTIDEDKLSELRYTAMLCRAIARAEGMLSSSDYSRQRLITRLMHHDLDREVCEKAADYMISKGYIREKEQTERITNFFCKSKHWGKKRIFAELMGRGYDRKYILAALSSVSDEEYYASLMKLIGQKYPVPTDDYHETEKRISSLGRMGFSSQEITRAIKEAKDLYMEALEN